MRVRMPAHATVGLPLRMVETVAVAAQVTCNGSAHQLAACALRPEITAFSSTSSTDFRVVRSS